MESKASLGQRLVEITDGDIDRISTEIAQSLKNEGYVTKAGSRHSVAALKAEYQKALKQQEESEVGASGEPAESTTGAIGEQTKKGSKRADRERPALPRRHRVGGGRSKQGASEEQAQAESTTGATGEQQQEPEKTEAPKQGAGEEQGFTKDEIAVLKQFASTLMPQDVDGRTLMIPPTMPTVAPGKKANHRIRRALLDESKRRAMKIWGIENVSDQDFLNFVLLWFAGYERDTEELRAKEPKAEEKKRK